MIAKHENNAKASPINTTATILMGESLTSFLFIVTLLCNFGLLCWCDANQLDKFKFIGLLISILAQKVKINKHCEDPAFKTRYVFISCGRTRNEPKKAAYGSDASAAGGRESEQSEWQRPIADDGFSKPRKISGTATGRR